MEVTEQTLIMMHEDLLKFITEGLKDKQIRIKNTIVRSTNKKDDERKDYKKYNTCIISERPFSETCKMYVHLDKSYDYGDIYKLAQQYVKFADYKIKQDAFQTGTLAAYHTEVHKDILPGNAFQLGLKDFKEMKSMEVK